MSPMMSPASHMDSPATGGGATMSMPMDVADSSDEENEDVSNK